MSDLLPRFREGKCCRSLTPGQSGAGGKKVFKVCLVWESGTYEANAASEFSLLGFFFYVKSFFLFLF